MQATRSHERHDAGGNRAADVMPHKAVGKSPLVGAAPGGKPPLFDQPAAWEAAEDETALVAALDSAKPHAEPAAHAASAGSSIAPDEPSAIAADEAAARPPEHDEDHEDDRHLEGVTARAASVQKKTTASDKKKKQKDAEKYNPPIRSNHRDDPATQYQRPGVRIGGANGHDKFELAVSPAKRYRIKDGSQAALVDQVNATQKVAVNPPHSRNLVLVDSVSGAAPAGAALPAAVPCVLTWEPMQGPAWTPIASLKEGAQIKAAADKLSKKDMPAAAPKDTTLIKYAFRDEPPAVLGRSHPTEKEKTQHISPHQPSGANMLDHYLERDGINTQLAPDEQGTDQSKRRYYSINLSPPQPHAPPIADDTAQPGDTFFVAQGGNFKVRVAIYDPATGNSKAARAHDKKPVTHQIWVYGFAAKTEGANVVPDRSRRGWVPLRDLKKL